jgi:cytochrome b561
MKHHSLIRALHWLMALLFLTIVLAVELTFQDRKLAMMVHKSLGLLTLGLVGLRIVTRLLTKAPTPAGSALNRGLAKGGHVALYALMVASPLTMLVAGLNGRGVDFFMWHFDAIWQNKDLAKSLKELHVLLANIFIYAALGHAAVALWHHFDKRDGTLTKMAP